MRRLTYVMIVLVVALGALAINPSIRVGKFKNAEKLVIKKGNSEPYSIFAASKASQFGKMFKILNEEGGTGKGDTRVEFWRSGDRKPFDVVWIDGHGKWGFDGLRTVYGRQPELLEWIKNETRG